MNKYRAWVKSEKRYIVDTQDFIPLIVTNKGVMKLQSQFEKNYYEILPLDWFIIEQFTGLRDKNGVEIYEGDIVKSNKSKYTRFNENGVYEIYFNEFLCHYALVDSSVEWNNKNGAYDNYSLTGAKTKDFEVIGNIHEESGDNED